MKQDNSATARLRRSLDDIAADRVKRHESVESLMHSLGAWSIVPLGNICKTTSGGTPSRKNPDYFRGTIPWVKSGELPNGPVVEIEEYISEEALRQSSAKLFPSGTLLIALYGATVGKLGILTRPAATNQAVCAIIPSPDIDTKYLFWFLRHKRNDLAAQAVGGAQPNISQGIIRALEVPLVPLDQQKRIVAEIEKQFSRLDEAVANLKRVKANLKRYKAAVLKAAVEGRLVETESAAFSRQNWKPIGLAVGTLDQGWSPQCESEPAESDETWAVMKTTAVQPLRFIDEENKRLPPTLDPRSNLELVAGDLLITRAGPRSRVGVACLVKATRPRLMLCDKAYRLRVKPDVAMPGFLEIVLNSPEMLDVLDELKTGISDSGVNLTQRRFRELSIPLPPLAEQQRIIAEVERCFSLADEAEALINANLKRGERLRQAVLQSAFMS